MLSAQVKLPQLHSVLLTVFLWHKLYFHSCTACYQQYSYGTSNTSTAAQHAIYSILMAQVILPQLHSVLLTVFLWHKEYFHSCTACYQQYSYGTSDTSTAAQRAINSILMAQVILPQLHSVLLTVFLWHK